MTSSWSLFVDCRVLLDEEVARLVQVRDLRLHDVQLVTLRPLGLLGVLKGRGLLGLLSLLRDDELGVVGALRGGVSHLLLVVLLGLLLVTLHLRNVILHVADHVIDHGEDAGAGLALLVLATRHLGRRPWLSGTGCDLRKEVVVLLLL